MGEDASQSKQRTELAESRTDWAEDRTLLANERTFAGWMRTGLASAALGLGFHAVFQKFEPTWLAKSVATIFVLVALVIFYFAFRKANAVCQRMANHSVEPVSSLGIKLVAGFISFATAGLGAVIWIL